MTVPTFDGVDALVACLLIGLLAAGLLYANWQRWDEERRDTRMWRRGMR